MRNETVRHAVRVAFGDSIKAPGYPVFVLKLEIPASLVDVNVHPAKQEIRFQESRHIHDFIRHAIARALREGGPPAGVEGGQTSQRERPGPQRPEPGIGESRTPQGQEDVAPRADSLGSSDLPVASTASSSTASISSSLPSSPKPSSGARSILYPTAAARYPRPSHPSPADQVKERIALLSDLAHASHSDRRFEAAGAFGFRVGGYLLVEGGQSGSDDSAADSGSLLLVDIAAAVRERMKRALDPSAPALPSRPLLIPGSSPVPKKLADRLEEAEEALRRLGVEFRRNAPDAMTLRTLPRGIGGIEAAELLAESVAAAGACEASGLADRLVENLYRRLVSISAKNASDADIADLLEDINAAYPSSAVMRLDEAILRRLFASPKGSDPGIDLADSERGDRGSAGG